MLTKFQRTVPSRIICTVPLILEMPLCMPFDEPSKRIVGYDGSKSPLVVGAPDPKRLEPEVKNAEEDLEGMSGDDIGEVESMGSRTLRSTSMMRTASSNSSSKKLGLRGPSFSEENWKGITCVFGERLS